MIIATSVTTAVGIKLFQSQATGAVLYTLGKLERNQSPVYSLAMAQERHGLCGRMRSPAASMSTGGPLPDELLQFSDQNPCVANRMVRNSATLVVSNLRAAI
jgi:hypothetical protein